MLIGVTTTKTRNLVLSYLRESSHKNENAAKPSTFLRILLLVSADVLIEAIEAHVVPFDGDLLTFELVPVVLLDELLGFLGAEHLHADHAVRKANVTK